MHAHAHVRKQTNKQTNKYTPHYLSVVGLRSRDRIFCMISATLCSHYIPYLGREWVIILGFPRVVYSSLSRCIVPTADALATVEDNCYN